MPKKHSLGCGCCCVDKPMFADDFSTVKDGYQKTADVFSVSVGRLVTSASASCFRTVATGGTENLRIVVFAQVFDNFDSNANVVGIFVGGIACVYIERVAGNFRVKFGLGCDAYGKNPTTVHDLIWPNGLGGGPKGNLTLTIENDWTNTGHLFVKAGGSYYGEYAAEVTASVGSNINVGMMGDGQWDNFQIVRNHDANICRGCAACGKPSKLPKTILLSVPPMDDGSCNCTQLSGDFVLKHKTYANRTRCVFDVTCVWVCDETGGCGDGHDVCGEGNLWQLNLWGGAMQLQSTNARDILEYSCPYYSFNCDPGAVNTFTYSCTVCDGACVGYPATLLTVNA